MIPSVGTPSATRLFYIIEQMDLFGLGRVPPKYKIIPRINMDLIRRLPIQGKVFYVL